MSASMNNVTLIGNLVKKPELQRTPKGTEYATLRLAVTHKTKGEDGKTKEDTTYLDISVWGRTAKFFAERSDKGCSVAIEGRLATSDWEKDGKKYSKLTIICENGQLLTWPQNKQPKNNNESADTGSTERPRPQQNNQEPETEDEDIPF